MPLHLLDADDAPNVFWGRQGEDEAGNEDSGAGPLKLPSLAVVKIRAEKPFTIWFATGTSSDKTAHLRRNPRAGISFFDRGDSVALTGTAEVIEYPAVKNIMWQEWFIKHFPGGVDDPEYCLVRFQARKGVFYIEDNFVKPVLK